MCYWLGRPFAFRAMTGVRGLGLQARAGRTDNRGAHGLSQRPLQLDQRLGPWHSSICNLCMTSNRVPCAHALRRPAGWWQTCAAVTMLR